MMKWWFWIMSLLVLSVLPVIAQSSATFEETDCPFTIPISQIVDCGYLIVPEDYDQPNAHQIRLAIAIFRHPSTNPEADPIIYLEGGPGGSAIKFADVVFATRYHPFFATHRDIIIFDQRGVGLSEPALDCPDYNNLYVELLDLEIEGQPVTRSESELRQQASLMACGKRLALQYDLSQYNSAASARDIEELRIALNYEQVNLWGISYGTRLALTMMRDYPESIRSVILDSTYSLEVNLFTDAPANWIHALNTLFDACASNENCHMAYPNLRETFLAIVAELDVNPVRVTTINRSTGETYQNVILDGLVFLQLNFLLLRRSNMIPFLPNMIQQASEGDFSPYTVAIGGILGTNDSVSIGMNYAVQCQEELAFIERGAIQAAYAAQTELQVLLAHDATRESDFEVCASFNAGESAAIENQPVSSDIPTLILGGQFDPITPPQWGQRVQAHLANSTYIEFPALSHAVIESDNCPQQIAIEFITDLSRSPDSSCAEFFQPQFYTPNIDPSDSTPTMFTNDDTDSM